MFESVENFLGETTFLIPEKTLVHVQDHVIGLIEQLLLSADPDMSLVELNVSEIASGLGLKVPSYVS